MHRHLSAGASVQDRFSDFQRQERQVRLPRTQKGFEIRRGRLSGPSRMYIRSARKASMGNFGTCGIVRITPAIVIVVIIIITHTTISRTLCMIFTREAWAHAAVPLGAAPCRGHCTPPASRRHTCSSSPPHPPRRRYRRQTRLWCGTQERTRPDNAREERREKHEGARAGNEHKHSFNLQAKGVRTYYTQHTCTYIHTCVQRKRMETCEKCPKCCCRLRLN